MKAEELLKRYAAGERSFVEANLNEANLSGANLSGGNFSAANLSVANLSGSNLSDAILSKAKLNVAKLSGANLSRCQMIEANLNVANLTLADLSEADLSRASLIRAELSRAELREANLSYANLSGADLKDAKLRSTNLNGANLSRTDLKRTVLTAANLMQANLHGADLSSADLTSADLSDTELRQANLSRAHLKGANLSGANLRWADLSGADLSWADLSGARLSGANLTGANLSYANLLNTVLVHADLTRANLINVEWSGADLSGSTLTGAKVHASPRYGIKTDEMICEWVDLSPNGDQSEVYQLTAESLKTFFHAIPPTVKITVDAPLDHDAHYALAVAYRQIAQHYRIPFYPPNIQVERRRTTLSFKLDRNDRLFLLANIVVFPFKDGTETQNNLISLMKMLQSVEVKHRLNGSQQLEQLQDHFDTIWSRSSQFKLAEAVLNALSKLKFFQAHTKTTLINSRNQTLIVYSHPMFGKRRIETPDADVAAIVSPLREFRLSLPSSESLIDFVSSFYSPEANS